jgi:hypothetical protein
VQVSWDEFDDMCEPVLSDWSDDID